ncbi:MAG: hypothetical protein WCB10_17810 [Steroidobacteraceae bacterium]
MDTTQPTTPEFFMEHGAASPEHARMLSEQAETMAGRRGPDARAALNITARDQPPPVATPTAAVPMTHAEIQESLAAHQNAQLAQELDKSMMPPPAPDFYQFPQGLTPQTDEAIAADQELRAAFHSEGFPRYLVESIGKDLAAAARTRMQETPEQAQQRVGGVRTTLEKWYGAQTDANIALVDRLVERLSARGSATRDFVQAMAPHLDALSIDALVQFAKHHRAGSRR